jgi:hypothetical protein
MLVTKALTIPELLPKAIFMPKKMKYSGNITLKGPVNLITDIT